jgi:hypothetical protein
LPAGTHPTLLPAEQYNVSLKFLSTIRHNISGNSVMTPLHRCHDNNQARSAGGTVCHDPHGVIGKNAISNLAMVNLDTAIARKSNNSTNSGLYYRGDRIGCYLTRHGENDNPETYRYQ